MNLVGRAKHLEGDQVAQLLERVERISRMPERDRLVILLSFRAGLRAGEIAKLRVRDLTDASGRPAKDIILPAGITKGGRHREVPMHKDIREALIAFRARYPRATHVALARRAKGSRPRATSAPALTVWFHRIFKELGYNGMSSHSGRRSFGTALARLCHTTNMSLIDVQRMLGHSMLSTTEAYVEPLPRHHLLIDAL